MANGIVLNIDTTKSEFQNPMVQLRQGDGNYQSLAVTVTSNGEPFDLTGWTITFMGTTAGWFKIVDEAVSNVDATNGKFTYTPTKAWGQDQGEFKNAYFKFTKADETASGASFRVNVLEAVDLTAEEAGDYISIVDQTIATLNTDLTKLQRSVDDLKSQNNAIKTTDNTWTGTNTFTGSTSFSGGLKGGQVNLPASGDLNTLTDTGKYYQNTSVNVSNWTNRPSNAPSLAFSVDVIGQANRSLGTQVYYVHTTSRMWVRTMWLDGTNIVTSQWAELANDNNVVHKTGDETVAGGKTFTGNNTFTQNISGNITGNSGTTTKLQTSRKINGVSFDGTSDININLNYLNVKNFGAVGDKLNDDAPAINQTFLTANQTGVMTVYIPKGTYLLKNDLDFQSNTHVILHPEAVLYGPGVFFRFRSFGKGYGNGVSNVKVEGGTFSGDFDANISYSHVASNAFVGVFHHNENIKFDNVKFYMTTSNSHTFDLGGSRNIFINNCSFYGLKPSTINREYVEAIQVDYSNAGALTDKSPQELANVDGLPSYNVSVTNSTFDAIYNEDGSIKYYAPNAIGEHASYSDGLIHDILFENNKITNAMPYNNNAYINGWVHFFGANNVKIIGNKFLNTKSYAAVPFSLKVSTSSPLGKGSETSLDNTLYDQHNNILFEGNVINGFNNSTNVNGLLTFMGNSTAGYQDNNIKIKNNVITNSFPATADKNNPSIANGSDAISFKLANDIEISGNTFSYGRRFIISQDADNLNKKNFIVKISNNIINDAYYIPISLDDFNNKGQVTIENNMNINTNGFLNLKKIFMTRISNNYINYQEDGKILPGQNYADVSIQINNLLNVIIQNNNILQSINPTYQYPKAITKVGAASNILLSDGNYFNGTLL